MRDDSKGPFWTSGSCVMAMGHVFCDVREIPANFEHAAAPVAVAVVNDRDELVMTMKLEYLRDALNAHAHNFSMFSNGKGEVWHRAQ